MRDFHKIERESEKNEREICEKEKKLEDFKKGRKWLEFEETIWKNMWKFGKIERKIKKK